MKARKHMCVINHHDMTLAVKVALNPNTTNQPTKCLHTTNQTWMMEFLFETEKTSRENPSFLAPLAEGCCHGFVSVVRACVRPFMCPSVRPFVRACVCKLLLQKTSSQKLLTVFLQNFTGMFLNWSSFKFLQIIVFYEEFWSPWRSK